jgi:Holliday junction DNA helicase RuvB
MEDFKVDFIVDKGAFARTINIPLKRFSLVGATTRAGFLSAPLRERFGIFFHLDFYAAEELELIVKRSAKLLNLEIDKESVEIIASRSRGTPRIANRLLRRVRDFTQVKYDGKITGLIAVEALEMQGVDNKGLDSLDRKYMKILIENYNCGPAGIEALAATINEEIDTLEDVVEPYLLSIGFLQRTKQGRKATSNAAEHFDFLKKSYQKGLFNEKSEEMA